VPRGWLAKDQVKSWRGVQRLKWSRQRLPAQLLRCASLEKARSRNQNPARWPTMVRGGSAMKSTNVALLSTILDRIVEKVADNLRIAKILIQLGLDPDNVTYEAISNRLFEILLANITIANICALVGATFLVATLLTRTMVPLRVSNMISNVFFMAFGALAGDIRTFLVAFLFLPINAIRLRQMLNLVKKARNAVRGERSMDWLKPFMTQRKYREGEVLCKNADVANEMFLTVSGKFLVTEFGIELPSGSPVGELGFLTPNNQRTATVECMEAAQVLTITYERLLELYFQNPQFGYYFLVLTSQRLLQNIARAEGTIEQNKVEIARLKGIIEQNNIK
jgi:Cyclic nucleotide-binding domain